MPDQIPVDEALIARLDDLQRESERRTAELRSIAAELPAVVGRRALIRTLIGDAANNPNKREVVRRGVKKLLRAPKRLVRTVRAKFRNRFG